MTKIGKSVPSEKEKEKEEEKLKYHINAINFN
jgi:hypothetical protein